MRDGARRKEGERIKQEKGGKKEGVDLEGWSKEEGRRKDKAGKRGKKEGEGG